MKPRFPNDWTDTTAGEAFERVVRPVDVEPNTVYQEIGIRSHGKGIFIKPPVQGRVLGDKRVFWVEPDCLVVNIVFAWEQAVARTTSAEDGLIASHRFPMYRPRNSQISVDYVLYFLKSKFGRNLLEIGSPGGAGRNKTLSQHEFEELPLVLPPLDEQRRIVAVLDTWDRAIAETERLIDAKRRRKTAIVGRTLFASNAKRGFIRDLADINPRNARVDAGTSVSFVAMEDVSEAGSLVRRVERVRGDLGNGYPVIYDPEKARHIRYKGFNSSNLHPDLEIADYIADLKVKGVSPYAAEHLSNHKMQECDAAGTDEGGCWKIRDCLVFETDLNGQKYVLSGDRWYCIDGNLAKEVTDFFATVPPYTLPAAQAGDNEQTYNQRVATGGHNLLCLDRKLVPPTGQSHGIEACDFLGDDGALIHVKDQTSSSRLSHLFNQGTVSARVLKRDGAFRDLLRAEIVKQQGALGLSGYDTLIVGSTAPFDASSHKVVYAVICGATPSAARLPFFSLVTFRQAAKLLEEIGFPYAFAWIGKPAAAPTKKKRKPKSGASP